MRKINCRVAYSFMLTIVLFCSCRSTKSIRYFHDIAGNKAPVELEIAQYQEPKIQPDDILSINVSTADAEATQSINNRNTINQSASANPASGMVNVGAGYLVDKQGSVEIPILGKTTVGGLTTVQARNVIRDRALKAFNNPVVDVRFSNFKITLLGEVNRPATYIIPNEQVTILDAIGYAGDLTIYGKRENVLLIRKNEQGNNFSVRMDLTKKGLLSSPYFYLKQNDVIYIEPSKAKVLNSDNNLIKYLTLAASLLTAGVLAYRYL
ncbi:hypothetical protein EOD41_00540 [Mucilaginibacter limnophilus]|uniref:Uncharacterized protein n=1 Tax=Mucilaginibacter limnophilus TaxID=1932778 RepID=A0A3S2X0D2_9SPHI|nr:polysaccharide biosynthesis/export family protein [Mucilaginibacter limnophilus]RVU02461.1 hypothetical protein EOD41_00540 [Mucilaginibacter limnophilus]